ncbi:MAG: hypothetical protein DLM66_00095 [Candidatus Dormiibacter spiritus]|nr:MAG: hypothetical protein DLM66_00095 [Candidatus Dormibacteraeota bacterium]
METKVHPQRYRKKPIEIEAMRFDGSNEDDILSWASGHEDPEAMWIQTTLDGSHEIVIATSTGLATVHPGWWVCKGVESEFYPCKPSIFEATYEAVDG